MLRLRPRSIQNPFEDFENILSKRKKEADEFFDDLQKVFLQLMKVLFSVRRYQACYGTNSFTILMLTSG